MTIHSNSLTAAQPVVSVKDGKVFANSRDVAEFFGKEHKNVLRDIDNLMELGTGASLNFELCPYQVFDGGRNYCAFIMTRDGFTLLAMGFTGKKALQFKLNTSKRSTEWKPSSRQRIRFQLCQTSPTQPRPLSLGLRNTRQSSFRLHK